jgi:hypothetical protein
MSVARLVSAKNAEEVKHEKQNAKVENTQEAEKPLRQLCSTITINIYCDSSQSFNNTYCWEEGNQASFNEAIHCFETEHQMFNDEICN